MQMYKNSGIEGCLRKTREPAFFLQVKPPKHTSKLRVLKSFILLKIGSQGDLFYMSTCFSTKDVYNAFRNDVVPSWSRSTLNLPG
jgi:hypothetical protein